uniref:Putative secreted peptide n=1 Tax=Anopheles braziliensis TaxID=58242 RepID=A0A2M3ZS84_9DIPT
MRTVSWAVGATTRPGNQFSLGFFFLLSLVSTHTTLPMFSSLSLAAERECVAGSSSSSELSSGSRCRDLRPLRPPMTGLPKCSGCVSGS